MNGQRLDTVPPLNTVVPFFLTGGLLFFAFSVLLVCFSQNLLGHYFQLPTLAIVHTCALGWGTMIVFGAVHQLLPVINGRPLYSSKLALATYLLLITGTFCVVLGFLVWIFLLPIGGLFVVISAICYAVNVFCTSVVPDFKSPERLFLVSSCLWLVITVVLGLTLAINLTYPFLEINHLNWLKLHAHIGLGGWFLQLVTGISIKLLPMFFLGRSDKGNLLKGAFILQNLSIAGFFINGLLGGNSRILIYFLLVSGGIVLWLGYIYDAYRSRLKKKLDSPIHHAWLSLLLLVMGLALIPIIIQVSEYRFISLYGVYLFIGWISVLILGMTFKTLPFIIWNHRYKGIHGKVQIPLPRQLYSGPMLDWQLRLCAGSLLILTIGLLSEQMVLLHTGTAGWLIVSCLYIVNVLKIWLHKTQDIHGNIIKRSAL